MPGARTSRTSGWIFIAGALAAGALAAIGTAAVINEMEPRQAVMAYVRDLEPMHTLQKGDVITAERPAKGLPPDAVRSEDAAIGRVVLRGALAGDVVRQGNLVEPATGQGPLALKLESMHRQDEDGSRRVAFPLPGGTAGGIGSELRPGDKVDVIGVFDLPVGRAVGSSPASQGQAGPNPADVGTVPTAVAVVRGVPVLTTRPPAPEAQGPAAEGVIVLSLTPEEASRVALARSRGQVFLALQTRNGSRDPIPPVRLPELAAQGGAAGPAPAQP